MTAVFDESWKQIGLTDADLRTTQNELLEDPEKGDVIKRTGGARKLREGLGTHGKSGGIRVIYKIAPSTGRIYLLLAYPKNVQDDLTPEQEKILRNLIKTLQ